MQCELCEKNATVHLTEIVNGKKKERHLCEHCAGKEGVTIKSQVPISQILNNLVDNFQESQTITDLTCPQCHITWNDFRNTGLLGCPNDYVVFDKTLQRIIEKSQEGALYHVGRVPRTEARQPVNNQVQLVQLRKELQAAIEAEEYERAAHIRDKIGDLE